MTPQKLKEALEIEEEIRRIEEYFDVWNYHSKNPTTKRSFHILIKQEHHDIARLNLSLYPELDSFLSQFLIDKLKGLKKDFEKL